MRLHQAGWLKKKLGRDQISINFSGANEGMTQIFGRSFDID